MASHHEIRLRRVEVSDRSRERDSRRVDVELRRADLHIVFAEVQFSNQAIERDVTILDRESPCGRVNSHAVTIGQRVAVNLHRRDWEREVDTLSTVLISHARVADGELIDEVVERLAWLLGIAWWARQVIATSLSDVVVHP